MEAAGMAGEDTGKLTAFLQSHDNDDDDDDDAAGAPSATVYQKKQVVPIEDTLQGFKEKADAELADLRKAEATAQYNFKIRKASLEREIAANTKDLDEEKSAIAAATQAKSQAE